MNNPLYIYYTYVALAIAFLFILIFFFNNKLLNKFDSKIFSLDVNHLSIILLLIAISFGYQLHALWKEVLFWDINSYLIVAQDILRGNIPYELQWENKGPLLFYIFSIPLLIDETNFILAKLFSDFVFILVVINLYFLTYKLSKNKIYSFLASLFFILLTSVTALFHPGWSELYVLFFLSSAINIYMQVIKTNTKNMYLMIGLFLSCCLFISMSSSLLIAFLIGYFIFVEKFDKKVVLNLFIGGIIPVIIFFTIFASRGMINELIQAMIIIPYDYTNYNPGFLINFLELRSILFSYFQNDRLWPIFFVIVFSILNIFNFNYLRSKHTNFIFINSLLIISLIIFMSGTGYFHHAYYLLYFIAASFGFVDNKLIRNISSILIISTFLITFPHLFKSSINNINNMYDLEYPVYKEYVEIKNTYNFESVLALQDFIFLFYANLPNSSYYAHPGLYTFESFTKELSKNISINKISLKDIIKEQPDIIICGELIKKETCNNLENNIAYSSYKPKHIRSKIFINNKIILKKNNN